MVTLTPVEECGICQRREADVTVVIEGRIVGVCDTCYQRAEDERRGGPDDD